MAYRSGFGERIRIGAALGLLWGEKRENSAKKIRACRRARFFYGKMREKRGTGEMGWRGGIAGGEKRRNGEMAGRVEMVRGEKRRNSGRRKETKGRDGGKAIFW